MASHEPTFVPTNKVSKWLDARLPVQRAGRVTRRRVGPDRPPADLRLPGPPQVGGGLPGGIAVP